MKRIIYLSAIALLMLTTVSCDKEKKTIEEPYCICDSETAQPYCVCKSEKTKDINQVGTISYINYKDTDGEFFKYYDNTFCITVQEGSCYTHLIVCNKCFLDERFNDLKSTNKSLKIKFTAERKELSKTPATPKNPANITYGIIVLTSIEIL